VKIYKQLKTKVMNNEQFRKSITQVIKDAYERAFISLREAEKNLKENPRSFTLKEEQMGALRTLQAYQHLVNDINDGVYDDIEYYNKYIDPMSEYQKEINEYYNKTK
jgi:hypothetical protein